MRSKKGSSKLRTQKIFGFPLAVNILNNEELSHSSFDKHSGAYGWEQENLPEIGFQYFQYQYYIVSFKSLNIKFKIRGVVPRRLFFCCPTENSRHLEA